MTGSYSGGGTSTRPSLPLMPSTTPSRRPVMNAPMTGPVVRVNGYSMMFGAESTSASGVELNSPPQNSMTLRMVSPRSILAMASLTSSILIRWVIMPSRSSRPVFHRRSRRLKSERTSAEP